MIFIRHPEFNLVLEQVLKALKVLNSSDDKLEEFTSEVLSKRKNTTEYHNALNMFVQKNTKSLINMDGK